jgi:hypothetical protein
MASVRATSGWTVRHANHLHEGPVQIYTGCTASATVTGGQLLAVTATGTVGPAGANSAAVVGIALDDAASGAPVNMFVPNGVWTTVTPTGVTAGAKLVTGAAGTVETIAANTFEKIVGTALTTATGGNTVIWAMAS